jgi:hypothetical protein
MVKMFAQLLMLIMPFQFQFMLIPTSIFFPTLDIKSFKNLHTMHFAKVEPLFRTSTLKWYSLLN